MEKKLNVGIIGFGMAGQVFHAPIINSIPQLELTKIVTTNVKAIETIKKLYPNTEIVSDVSLILEDDDIDLIVIATPNTSHFELATQGLMANKHIVVEKPFTITTNEADKLIKLAKERKLVLTVHHNRRWDSDYLTVKKVIEGNLLGNIVEYESHFDRFRNTLKKNAWREENNPGSGILYDLGSHLIDQALCLFGLPMEVTADIGIQREGGKTDDYFHIILHYDKLRAILKAGMLVREPLLHFILLGDKGSFVKYGMDVQETALKEGITPENTENWGAEPEILHGRLNTEMNGVHLMGVVESERGDYRKYYQNVYNAILGKEELVVKAEEARNTIRVIELAIESNKTKKRCVF